MELACEALVEGNHSLALERFEELLRSEPNNTMVLNNYATSLLHVWDPPPPSPGLC
jgi:Tfp pilus assembly protein PilF